MLSLLPDLGGTKFLERAGFAGLLGALFFFGLDQESTNFEIDAISPYNTISRGRRPSN
jgi:hypothetical protein